MCGTGFASVFTLLGIHWQSQVPHICGPKMPCNERGKAPFHLPSPAQRAGFAIVHSTDCRRAQRTIGLLPGSRRPSAPRLVSPATYGAVVLGSPSAITAVEIAFRGLKPLKPTATCVAAFAARRRRHRNTHEHQRGPIGAGQHSLGAFNEANWVYDGEEQIPRYECPFDLRFFCILGMFAGSFHMTLADLGSGA